MHAGMTSKWERERKERDAREMGRIESQRRRNCWRAGW